MGLEARRSQWTCKRLVVTAGQPASLLGPWGFHRGQLLGEATAQAHRPHIQALLMLMLCLHCPVSLRFCFNF